MEFKQLFLDIGRTWSPVSSSTRPISSKSSTTSSSPSSVSNLAGRFSEWTTQFYSNSNHNCHRSAHAQRKWPPLLGMWTNWVNWVNLWTWTDCPSQNQWQSKQKIFWFFPNTAFWPFLTFASSDTTESWLEGKVQPLHARLGAGVPSNILSLTTHYQFLIIACFTL